MWTSPDGRHWTADTRDGATFEQDAWISGVGATADGAAIFGQSNINGTETQNDPTRQDLVLWMGSGTPASSPVGIVEGSLREVGGIKQVPAVAGTIRFTSADGHEVDTATDPSGRYAISLPPGSYTAVGTSPSYQNGAYDCIATIADSGAPSGPVDVRAGTVSHIDLDCEIF